MAAAKHGRAERRRRLLPARLIVYFVLAPCLFAQESYEEVLRMLTSGIPGSRALVTPADRTSHDAAEEVLSRLRLMHPESTIAWADSAYAGQRQPRRGPRPDGAQPHGRREWW